ncbi:hypothetical protein HDU93_005162 [Gonapodya sp. JEL0774]|nr:hypothetical protein HDU93_005162 [Gonapodya sp. JEL0774]
MTLPKQYDAHSVIKLDEIKQEETKPLPLARHLSTRSLTSQFGLSAAELAPFLNKVRRLAIEKGYDKKEATLVWRDVRVVGSKSLVSEGIPNFLEACLAPFLAPYAIFKSLTQKVDPTDTSATILHPTSGFLRPGEMLLVLGKPGSGTAPFVRVLGKTPGRIATLYKEVSGDITINGMENGEFKRLYQNEVLYSGDNDLHIPSLTVRETLAVATEFKIGASTAEEGVQNVRNEYMEFVEEWLGMSRAMDTIVGNEFLRGVSGGEKKRVSIAEQFLGSAALNVWDQTTRGLDSTYALQVIKGLRLVTSAQKRTTVVHITQTGDSIFKLFDRVALFAEGRTIYSGPTSQAHEYFRKLGFRPLPRQSTPDFLNSVTELKERVLADGVDPNSVPSTAQEFEDVWLKSENYREMMSELAEVEQQNLKKKVAESFDAAEKAYRRETSSASQDSVYARSNWEQFKVALKREILLMNGQRQEVISNAIYVILIAIVLSSVSYQMPLTPLGALARAGLVFFALLFSAVQTQTDVPALVSGRSYVYKHKEWSFYHAGIRFISWCAADVPTRVINTITFGTILYWMAGLNPQASRFFIFLLVVFFTGFAYAGFSRFITAISPNEDTAIRMNAVYLIPCLIYSGFLIPYPQVHPWFVWFVWLNPLAYGYRALMGNEFRGLTFQCEGVSVVPPYPDVSDAYKTCNVAGATPGSLLIDGSDYVYQAFGFTAYSSTVWWNFGAVAGLFVISILMAVVVSEIAEFGASGINSMIYKKGKLPRHLEKADDTSVEINENAVTRVASLEMSNSLNLTWRGLSYWITLPTGERQLLTNISGAARPGRMLALMGFTGAGKTTLQDVLTRRKTDGRIEGSVYVGSLPQTSGFKRIMGYAEQMDVHTPTSTIREALRFSAYLRQPPEVSVEEKNRFVEEIIELMGLTDIADALVGKLETGVGINLTDRKRLTIAIELCARPEFLVLDEPTSGLDSFAAFQIVKLLKKLAEKGQVVLCTIHQPSAILFEHFDDLLMLGPGGKTLYYGEIGPSSKIVTSYFEKRGAAPYDPNENPAEYVMDAGNGLRNDDIEASVDWVALWKESEEANALEAMIDRLRNIPVDDGAQELQKKEYSLNTLQQIPIVLERMMLAYYRNPDYTFGRVTVALINTLILSFSYYQVSHDAGGVSNRIYAIFNAATSAVATIMISLPHFLELKKYFKRENAQGFYNWFSFCTAITIAEIPYTIIQSTVYFVIFYYVIGLSKSLADGAVFWAFFTLLQFFAVSIGQWMSALLPNLPLVTVLASLITTVFPGFAGVGTPISLIPKFWYWMYYLDPYYYFSEATLETEMHGLNIQCQDSEFLRFAPPPNNTCESYMAPYFAAGGPGYLQDPTSTTLCGLCQSASGEATLANQFSFSHDNIWRNFGILVAMIVMNRVLLYVFMRRNAMVSAK